jgi:hypothetical protein
MTRDVLKEARFMIHEYDTYDVVIEKEEFTFSNEITATTVGM